MKKNMVGGFVLAGTLLMVACEDPGPSSLVIEADGVVGGLVWLDRNGNGEIDATDGPVEDVVVELVSPASGEVLYTATSTAFGEFDFGRVPVGDYEARVDSATAGDSLQVLRLDSADVTVAVEDTAVVLVGFTYPTLTVDTALDRPLESRVFVEGRALNGWATFGDSTLHVRDGTGAIRAVE